MAESPRMFAGYKAESLRALPLEERHLAEQVAGEKLSLLNGGFLNYGIRFMNIDEYREGIASGQFGKEVFVSDSDNPIPLDEFIRKNQLWEITSRERTDWNSNSSHIEAHKHYLNSVAGYYLKAKKENVPPENIRSEVMRRIREGWMPKGELVADTLMTAVEAYGGPEGLKQRWESLRQNVGEEAYTNIRQEIENYLGSNPHEVRSFGNRRLDFKKILEKNGIDPNSELYFELIKIHSAEGAKRFYGKERTKLVEQLILDPAFLTTEENLRKVLEALAYAPRGGWSSSHYPETRQYHAALVFNLAEIPDSREIVRVYGWHDIGKNPLPGKAILGAIALTSDRKLEQELTELSLRSGDRAHAVFSAKGRVIFPSSL